MPKTLVLKWSSEGIEATARKWAEKADPSSELWTLAAFALDALSTLGEQEARIADLEADKARLDAIDELTLDVDWLVPNSDPAVVEVANPPELTHYGNGFSVREAIDQALAHPESHPVTAPGAS